MVDFNRLKQAFTQEHFISKIRENVISQTISGGCHNTCKWKLSQIYINQSTITNFIIYLFKQQHCVVYNHSTCSKHQMTHRL